MSGNDTDALLTLIFLGLIPLAFLIYAIPSIIAFRRRHPNRFAILVINIAFGGTGIGWLGALVWALSAVHLSNETGGSNGGESGLNLVANDAKPVRLVSQPANAVTDRLGEGSPTSITAAVSQIERLSTLRANGHLTESEFTDLKATVLNRAAGFTSV